MLEKSRLMKLTTCKFVIISNENSTINKSQALNFTIGGGILD